MYAPVTGQLQRDIRGETRFAFRKKEDKLFLSLTFTSLEWFYSDDLLNSPQKLPD